MRKRPGIPKSRFIFALTIGTAALALSAEVFAKGPLVGPFFNHSENSHYTDSYRNIFRTGDDLESLILNEIENARTSIDVAVQELRLPKIAQALARRHREGVRVRVLIENQYNYTIAELDPRSPDDHEGRRNTEYFRFVDMNSDGVLSPYEISQRDAMWIIRNARIPLQDDTADGSKGSGLMHHKFVIADSKRLLVTSANFTMSDTHGDYSSQTSRGNTNALMIFQNFALVDQFQREFDILWGGGPKDKNTPPRFGLNKPYRGALRSSPKLGTAVTVQFSPTSRTLGFEASTSGLIERVLGRAQSSIEMALFVFSEQRISTSLERLRRRFPLDIKVLVERNFAYAWFSELLDMMGLQMWGHNCVREVANNPWKDPIHTVGSPHLDSGDFLHHKFAVIDGKITIFGSQNWSVAANQSNDENLLVIEDLRVSRKFSEEFRRLYRNSRLGPTKALRERIREREIICGPMP
jgi:phosphatidylserine/phosphatidylglycerophosphate/cardiolipin synthase-like enzyme